MMEFNSPSIIPLDTPKKNVPIPNSIRCIDFIVA